MNEIISLDSPALGSWFSTCDLLQEACKLCALARREPEEDCSEIEQFASQDLEPTDIVSTHPALLSFVMRQHISGQDFCSPGFIPDVLLPYLENVVGMDKLSLCTFLGGTDMRKASNFDSNPDTHSLITFLESILQQRLNGEFSDSDALEQSVRSFALLHYALRVLTSGQTLPSTTNTAAPSNAPSPSFHRRNQSDGNFKQQMSLPGSLPASLPQSPTVHNSNNNNNNNSYRNSIANQLNNLFATPGGPGASDDNNNNNNNNNNAVEDNDLTDLPPMIIGANGRFAVAAATAGAGGATPALPKQEVLSGSRRHLHRRWQEWREIGRKALAEGNLPVTVAGISYTALHCFAEALDEFLLSTNGGATAHATGEIKEYGSFALNFSPSGKFVENNNSNNNNNITTATAPTNNAADANAAGAAGGGGADNFALPSTATDEEDLAQSEAELWSLLSQSMPLGKSAVSVFGEMHTKESAMARSVQADPLNASRWLELARLLPSETGKKRISKRKKNTTTSGGKSNNSSSSTSSSNKIGTRRNNDDNSSPSRRRNFGNLLNGLGGNSVTPPSAARSSGGGGGRKFDLNFDDFAAGAGGGGGSGGNNNAAQSPGLFGTSNYDASATNFSASRRTRAAVPMVDGRVISRVLAYAECLKLDLTSPAEVWSELGLHMPLHPPNDAVFVNNTSYTSRSAHETALEKDPSLADSWLDLGWQLLEDKKSTVINGRVLSATDCFKEALIRVPSDLGEAWSLLAQSLPDNASEKVEVGNETYTKTECFRQALKLDPQCISAWIGLGRMLPRGSRTEVNGKEFSQLGLFYHALEMDDSDAVAWNGLGAMLGPVDKAVFHGETLTRRQCYLRALECDPYLARVWNNLGLDLGDPRVDRNDENFHGGRTIETDYVYFAGKKYDSKAAFIRALHCEGGNVSTSWVNLGMLLAPKKEDEGGTAVVVGKTVDKKRCYYEAVRSNERNAIAWNNLGAVMDADESVIVGKKEQRKLDCYRHALEFDNTLSNAWYNIVCVMIREEKSHPEKYASSKIKVKIGSKEFDKVQCMLNAVETNPENGNAWKMLQELMFEYQVKSFTKKDGGVVTIKECERMINKYPATQ